MTANRWRLLVTFPYQSGRDATDMTARDKFRLARLKPRQAFHLKEKTTWQCKLILFVECR
jgi:hypothetical protein